MTKQTEALRMAYDWLNEYAPIEVVQACKEALEQPAQEPVTRAQQVIRANNSAQKSYEKSWYDTHPAQPAQEPVAWIKYVWKSDDDGFYPDIDLDTYDNGGDPLYTHPAPSWKGLNDDEILEIDKSIDPEISIGKGKTLFARAIEQALKEKND